MSDDESLVPAGEADDKAPKSLIKLDRAATALKMYREGKSIRQIAAKTGYKTVSGAWAAVKKAIELEAVPEAELVRGLELQRLDWLTRVMTKAIEAGRAVPETDKETGEPTGRMIVSRGLARNVEVYLKVMERRALLLGLDIGEQKDERVGPSITVLYNRDPNQEQRRRDVAEILDGTDLLISSAEIQPAGLPDPGHGSPDPDDSLGGGDGLG